jgi:hypothetical protein
MSTMVTGVLLVCSAADDTIRVASGPDGIRWHARLGVIPRAGTERLDSDEHDPNTRVSRGHSPSTKDATAGVRTAVKAVLARCPFRAAASAEPSYRAPRSPHQAGQHARTTGYSHGREPASPRQDPLTVLGAYGRDWPTIRHPEAPRTAFEEVDLDGSAGRVADRLGRLAPW